MHTRRTLLTALTTLLLAAPAAAGGQSLVPDYDGAAATGLALRRLGTTARVLHIGAHPDDENTALFAPLALGRGVDVAYLSLTRGEGGQNGIGPELGVALGVIRSEELLAARRLDGGEQFFTRAIDYGYSKNAEEAFRHWPRDTLLADVVAVIRHYRPDVVVSVWSGTPRDGHGQHEASGIIAREAVIAAADPSRFPEQIEAGLHPHETALYYRSAWFSEGPPDVELNTGELDPLLGASYHQIAMASRSRHRSQDQGRRLDPGPRRTAFDLVDPTAPVEVAEIRSFGRYGEGAPESTRSLFEGVDTLLSQRADHLARLAEGETRHALEQSARRFRAYEELVRGARESFDPFSPWTVVPALLEAQDLLIDAAVPGSLSFHARQEMEDLQDALLSAANIELEVVADESRVVAGQTFRLTLSAWNGSPTPVTVVMVPMFRGGLHEELIEGVDRSTVAPGERATATWAVTVAPGAPLTMPYYLDPREPAPVDLYSWPVITRPITHRGLAVQGLPFSQPPVRGFFAVDLAQGHRSVPAARPASWIGVDARDGEYREPVKIVPAVSVAMEPELAVLPLSTPDRPLPFTIRLRSQAADTIAGDLRPLVPAGWRASPESLAVTLEPGADHAFDFEITPPAGITAGEYEIESELLAEDGTRYDLGYDVVDYPHIAPHHLYSTARARVRALDVEVADVRVGYVMGAGDGVPEALDQLGVDWSLLDDGALTNADLSRFDVIITGTRAYEVNDALVASNQRLLDWARRGGTLIVQYNKYPALSRDYAPWPVTIARPHGRVTDETAAVTVLEPTHPVFNTPNGIGTADWQGWVQERGLYFWDTWDGPLTPLLAMSDPGEEPLTGSLLVAPIGQGTYVYTALAFFRQLPEGVPGAYRLLANLISLGADR